MTAKPASPLARTLAYGLSFIGLGLTSASLGPSLLGLAQQTGDPLSRISFLFTARAFGYMSGSFAGGRMLDRWPGHRLMGGALAVIAALLASVPAISWDAALAATFLAVGMMEGILDVGGNALLIWTHGDRVAPYMNGLHLFYAIGAFASPALIAQSMSRTGSYEKGYWLLALLNGLIAIRFALLPDPERGAASEESSSGLPDRRLLVLVVFFFLLVSGSEQSFGGWVYAYSVKTGMASRETAAYVNSAFWGAFMIGRAASIPLGARFRPWSILLADLTLSLAGLTAWLAFPASPLALWAGTILFGLGIASAFPTLMTFAGRRMKITGAVTGWLLVGASGGTMILPWLIGQGFEPIGPKSVPLAIGSALVIALGLYGALLKGLK